MTGASRHVYRSRPPAVFRPALAVARRFTDAGHRASVKPFDHDLNLLHHTELPARFAWSHHGLMLPSLPAPHNYLSLMVMSGKTGLRVFDSARESTADGPQDIFVASASSGAENACARQVLSARHDGRFASDRAEFGTLASITGTHPDFEIRIHADELEARVSMTCRSETTWFVKSPVYQHIGHVGHYEGEVTYRGTSTPISGVGTYDCPQRFAIGRGYISGYQARVRMDGEEFTTRGYSEHIDERHPRRPNQ